VTSQVRVQKKDAVLYVNVLSNHDPNKVAFHIFILQN